jgi:hypothetical protein
MSLLGIFIRKFIREFMMMEAFPKFQFLGKARCFETWIVVSQIAQKTRIFDKIHVFCCFSGYRRTFGSMETEVSGQLYYIRKALI